MDVAGAIYLVYRLARGVSRTCSIDSQWPDVSRWQRSLPVPAWRPPNESDEGLSAVARVLLADTQVFVVDSEDVCERLLHALVEADVPVAVGMDAEWR